MKRRIMTVITAAMAAGSATMMFAMSAFAEGEAAASGDAAQNPPQGGGSILTFVLPLVLMFVLLYFMAIRPQKKRDAEAKQMQESLQVGDEVITSGGIVGMIFRIADDTVVIETGGERHKLRIKKWAIAENVSGAERMRAAQAKTKLKGVESAAVDTEDEGKKSKKKKKSEETDEQ